MYVLRQLNSNNPNQPQSSNSMPCTIKSKHKYLPSRKLTKWTLKVNVHNCSKLLTGSACFQSFQHAGTHVPTTIPTIHKCVPRLLNMNALTSMMV